MLQELFFKAAFTEVSRSKEDAVSGGHAWHSMHLHSLGAGESN